MGSLANEDARIKYRISPSHDLCYIRELEPPELSLSLSLSSSFSSLTLVSSFLFIAESPPQTCRLTGQWEENRVGVGVRHRGATVQIAAGHGGGKGRNTL